MNFNQFVLVEHLGLWIANHVHSYCCGCNVGPGAAATYLSFTEIFWLLFEVQTLHHPKTSSHWLRCFSYPWDPWDLHVDLDGSKVRQKSRTPQGAAGEAVAEQRSLGYESRGAGDMGKNASLKNSCIAWNDVEIVLSPTKHLTLWKEVIGTRARNAFSSQNLWFVMGMQSYMSYY